MVVLAQLVRAPDCGSGGRGFEPHIPPFKEAVFLEKQPLFLCILFYILIPFFLTYEWKLYFSM